MSHFQYSTSIEAQRNYEKFYTMDYELPYRRLFFAGILFPFFWIILVLKGGYDLCILSRADISPHAPTALELYSVKKDLICSWVTYSLCGLSFYLVCGFSLCMMFSKYSQW